MSDAGPQQQISEEELQAYMAQLREAPLSDVVAQTIQILLNAAQVKLGRPDGRTLIDVVAAIRDVAEDQLDERLVQELDNALNQLRMAQVEAEGRETAAAASGGSSDSSEADTPDVATPEDVRGTPRPDPRSSGGGGGDSGSRLWTPGQP